MQTQRLCVSTVGSMLGAYTDRPIHTLLSIMQPKNGKTDRR